MANEPGTLILDTNCIGRLESNAARHRFEVNTRVADWRVYPTVVNVLEILNTENPHVRSRLLGTLAYLAANRPLMPWPYELLKIIAQAILEKKGRIELGPSEFEWILDHPERVSDEQLDAARTLLNDQEMRFREMHERGRPKLQAELKRQGLRYAWPTPRDFLDQTWTTESHLDTYVEQIWGDFGFPSPAPVSTILRTETWRLFFDGQGIGAYERGVAERPPKQVHQMDLVQLVYLGESRRRMIATADQGMLRAAKHVLEGRYPGARAIHIDELLS